MTEMFKRLKILFIPIGAVGHVNPAIGIAQVLIERGHRVMFAINYQWKGRLTSYGIEEIIFSLDERKSNEDPAKHWAEMLINGGAMNASTPLEKATNIITNLLPIYIKENKTLDLIIEDLINTLIPDVMILDQILCIPSVVRSGIPWVCTNCSNPLMYIDDERTPPFSSGLKFLGQEREVKEYKEVIKSVSYDNLKLHNDYIVSRGVHIMKPFFNCSEYLNIYGFPLELDYLDIRPLPPKWVRFDNLKRTEKQVTFEILPELANKSGKLIYFSLGFMGGIDIKLMKRLVSILSESPHRYIVSKGPSHSDYELAPNMWGEKSVPQIQVLPIVDLVITHGGNNTVTETFYFGKPLIVMPLFGEQYDNAQRIEDKGFGIRLDPYRCTSDVLLKSIESLLNDKELNEKLMKISKRIQTENSIEKLPKLIEDLVNKTQ